MHTKLIENVHRLMRVVGVTQTSTSTSYPLATGGLYEHRVWCAELGEEFIVFHRTRYLPRARWCASFDDASKF